MLQKPLFLQKTYPGFVSKIDLKGLFQHLVEIPLLEPEVFRQPLLPAKGDVLLEYYKTLADLLKKNLERVQADDYYLTQKYKSENKDKPWNGCEDAAKRAVYKLIGEAEVIDPVRKR